MNIPDPVGIPTPLAVHGLVDHLGLRLTTHLDHALDHPEEYDGFIWGGETPRDETGRFWIPAIWNIPALQRMVAVLAHDQGVSTHTARLDMTQYHTGMKQTAISFLPWAYAEIDHLGMNEQLTRYAALSESTGLRWCLQVFTGGKSIHAYLAFDVAAKAGDPRWQEIQKLLVVILEGDTQIMNPGRLMRLPGWAGADRPHPVLHWAPEHRYPIQEVLDRLRAYAAALGIDNVEVAYRTLRTAEELEWQARRETFSDASMELREHAALLRSTRGNPADGDLRLADAMLGRGRKGIGASRDSTFSGFAVGQSHPSEWNGLSAGRFHRCPWCGSTRKRVLSVIERDDGTLFATCFKERLTRCSAWATSGTTKPVTDEELEAILVSLVEPPSEHDDEVPEDEDTNWGLLTQADRLVARLEAGRVAVLAVQWQDMAIPETVDVLADDDVPTNGTTPNIEESDRSSLYKELHRLQRSLPDEAENLDEATEAFTSLGGRPVWCASGPTRHASGDEKGEAKATRLSCNRWGCYTCGPRLKIALQAAAMVILRGYDSEDGWSAACIQGSGDALRQGLRRWHRGAPRDRLYLGIAQSPETVINMVMWHGDQHRPKSWGALGVAIQDGYEVDDTLEEAVGTLVAEVNLQAWGAHDGRSVILRGCKPLRGAVAELRDKVLGRTRGPREASPPEGTVAVRSYTPLSQVREMAEELAQSDTVVVSEGDVDSRSRTMSTTWAFSDGVTPADSILGTLIEQGRIPPVRRRRRGQDLDDLDGLLEVIE
jgi:hypothetical protein